MKPNKAQKPRGGWNFLYLAALLFCLVLISTRGVAGLYGRYSSSDSAQDSATVAPFVFELTDGNIQQVIDTTGLKKPGDSIDVQFSVTNKSGSVTSAVAENYTIRLELRGSMPLEATLDPPGNASKLERVPTEAQPTTEEVMHTGTLPAGQEASHSYTLTLTWPADANNPIYASQSAVAEALLTVTGEQID